MYYKEEKKKERKKEKCPHTNSKIQKTPNECIKVQVEMFQ